GRVRTGARLIDGRQGLLAGDRRRQEHERENSEAAHDRAHYRSGRGSRPPPAVVPVAGVRYAARRVGLQSAGPPVAAACGTSALRTGGGRMTRRLFVGSLPFGAEESALQDLFAQAGPVDSVRVMRDQATGRSRGFGFVEMGTEEAAQAAI